MIYIEKLVKKIMDVQNSIQLKNIENEINPLVLKLTDYNHNDHSNNNNNILYKSKVTSFSLTNVKITYRNELNDNGEGILNILLELENQYIKIEIFDHDIIEMYLYILTKIFNIHADILYFNQIIINYKIKDVYIIIIVMKKFNSNLFEYLKNNPKIENTLIKKFETQLEYIFNQILDENIINTDMKPMNIVVDIETYNLYLIDFNPHTCISISDSKNKDYYNCSSLTPLKIKQPTTCHIENKRFFIFIYFIIFHFSNSKLFYEKIKDLIKNKEDYICIYKNMNRHIQEIVKTNLINQYIFNTDVNTTLENFENLLTFIYESINKSESESESRIIIPLNILERLATTYNKTLPPQLAPQRIQLEAPIIQYKYPDVELSSRRYLLDASIPKHNALIPKLDASTTKKILFLDANTQSSVKKFNYPTQQYPAYFKYLKYKYKYLKLKNQ